MKNIKLYQQIADDLLALINQGIYAPGDKLPSIRTLSAQRKVSIATIQRALEELEIRGVIYPKAKSGFYVSTPVNVSEKLEPAIIPMVPKAVSIHQQASEIFRRCEGPGIVNLGTSYSAAAYCPARVIQKIASKIVKQQINDILQIKFSAGKRALTEILSKRLNETGCRISPEELIITNGCLEALSLCLRAVASPGDTIAIESPGFVGALQLIELLGYQAVEIPCHSVDGLSLEALELALEQWRISAVVIVPGFSNPLGTNMPEENREQLVKMLADRDIPLIEDDLLGELSFDGSRTKPCKAFDKKGMVLYCSSASKTIASGLRVGWIAPGIYHKEISHFKTFTNIGAPQFSQLIITEFINTGKYDRHLRQLTSQLAKQVYKVRNLIKQFFPEGTQISGPKGGSTLWVALPKSIDGYQLYEKAITAGIGIIPGQLSTTSNKFNHCVRINCACDPEIDIASIIKKLASLAKALERGL